MAASTRLRTLSVSLLALLAALLAIASPAAAAPASTGVGAHHVAAAATVGLDPAASPETRRAIRHTYDGSAVGTVVAAEDVGPQLASRAGEIHSALDEVAQARRTTAIRRARGPNGEIQDFVASGGRDLSPAQRAVLRPGEVPLQRAGAHAEETLWGQLPSGWSPIGIGVSRPFCWACGATARAGATSFGDTWAVWR